MEKQLDRSCNCLKSGPRSRVISSLGVETPVQTVRCFYWSVFPVTGCGLSQVIVLGGSSLGNSESAEAEVYRKGYFLFVLFCFFYWGLCFFFSLVSDNCTTIYSEN